MDAVVNVAPKSSARREELFRQFEEKIQVNFDLDRSLVSFQADKETPFFRWFKYREGFTSRLVRYLLTRVHPTPGTLLDPFSGSGAALFAAGNLGWTTFGIELLPVGLHIAEARVSAGQVDPQCFSDAVRELKQVNFEAHYDANYSLNHIPITRGAFSEGNERALVGYIAYCNSHLEDKHVRRLALFASFCILEDISFTRKDGQYLRWDARSGRVNGGKTFYKGEVYSFDRAIKQKLDQMEIDLSSSRLLDCLEEPVTALDPMVIQGSSLEELPAIRVESVDCILTSPPYCNRYDYTRTYALELLYLGAGHDEVTKLRQAMLSCTVENKTKRDEMKQMYEHLKRHHTFCEIEQVFDAQEALHEVLAILDWHRDAKRLNNPHIARMVRNYFYEMCFVIYEMARVLAPGGYVIMVNDNVRYAGEEVPVDLILSNMAKAFGLQTDKIWTLPRGKGNSSQQMGEHGRTELRKCIYVWRKPTS